MPVFHRRFGWFGWPRGYDTDTLNAGKPEKTLDNAVDHVVSRLVHDARKTTHA